MKKIFFSTLILFLFLFTSNTFAAYSENVPEDTNLSSIKRLAIGFPRHYKVEETEPTDKELAEIMFFTSKVARCYVISYDEIAENIKKDTGVDIKSLDAINSEKVFEENFAKYADGYVLVTTATNSKRVQYFFDVQNSANENVYSLSTQSSDLSRDLKGYRKACEDFYKKFDAAVENRIKAEEKAARKKK